MRHSFFVVAFASLLVAPFALTTGCGGATDIDYKGPDAAAGTGGGTIPGGGGGISDGGGGMGTGGVGNVGGGGAGGVGNAGGAPTGGGGAGGAGVVCGGVVCPPPSLPMQAASCCAGDKCGLTSGFLGGQCIELNQPGVPDASCPPQSIQGFSLPGCCKPTGTCGVQDSFLGFGCVDPSLFTGQPSPKCGSVDAGTGGTGGVDAGTGGTGTGGEPTDGGTDAGTPGATTCVSGGVTSVCSPTQNCCVLAPGPDYCSDKATACKCSTNPNCDITVVSCDGPEDCTGGTTCCGTFSQQLQSYTKTECQPTCNGAFEREICHPNGTCVTPGKTCSPSPFLPINLWRCN